MDWMNPWQVITCEPYKKLFGEWYPVIAKKLSIVSKPQEDRSCGWRVNSGISDAQSGEIASLRLFDLGYYSEKSLWGLSEDKAYLFFMFWKSTESCHSCRHVWWV